MEGIHTLKSIVLEGNWLVKVDLKEAYVSVKNAKSFYASSQGQVLPVQLSPLWPGLSPMGLYRDLGAGSNSRSGAGDTDGCLHRQHSGRHQGENQGSRVHSLYICYSAWASQ